ncbi:MAG: zinc ribbon domain-containing protein [Succinivibrionaceae bacterium]
MICSKCGAEIPSGKFCPKCGSNLNNIQINNHIPSNTTSQTPPQQNNEEIVTIPDTELNILSKAFQYHNSILIIWFIVSFSLRQLYKINSDSITTIILGSQFVLWIAFSIPTLFIANKFIQVFSKTNLHESFERLYNTCKRVKVHAYTMMISSFVIFISSIIFDSANIDNTSTLADIFLCCILGVIFIATFINIISFSYLASRYFLINGAARFIVNKKPYKIMSKNRVLFAFILFFILNFMAQALFLSL